MDTFVELPVDWLIGWIGFFNLQFGWLNVWLSWLKASRRSLTVSMFVCWILRWPTSDILHPKFQLAPQPHHNHITLTLNGCGVGVVLVWCGCVAVVVRAGLGEWCHLWSTVYLSIRLHHAFLFNIIIVNIWGHMLWVCLAISLSERLIQKLEWVWMTQYKRPLTTLVTTGVVSLVYYLHCGVDYGL